MKQFCKRIACLFLALCMLIPAIATSMAAGTGAIEITSVDDYLQATIDLTNCPAANRPQYRIYDARGDVAATVTAGANGVAVAANLDVGSYEAEQIVAAPGYAKVNGTFTVAVTASHTTSNPAKLDFSCKPTAVTVEKIEASDKSHLEGIAFSVKISGSTTPINFAHRADGNYVYCSGMYTALESASASSTVATDADGMITLLYLPVGTAFTLTEQDVSDAGFRTADEQTFTVYDENSADYPVRVGVENWPLYLRVTKKDAATNDPIPNSKVKVLDVDDEPLHFTLQEDGTYKVTPDGLTEIPTGSDGTVTISHIPIGAYDVVDIPAAGYGNIPNTAATVTTDSLEDTPATATVNSQSTCVRILAKDKLTGAPIPNANLTVSDSTNTLSDQTGVTGADGMLTITYLPVGSYSVQQTQVLGYAPMAAKSFSVTASHVAATPLQVTLENDPAVVEITVKDGVSNAPITQAVYNLLDGSGNPAALVKEAEGTYRIAITGDTSTVTDFSTNASGIAVLHGNTNGLTVHMRVPESGKGYTPDTAITLQNVAVNKIALTALPTAVQIKSVASGSSTALPGATYSVTRNGESAPVSFRIVDGKYVHDASGTTQTISLNGSAEALLYGLPAGKYKVVETKTPTGYFPATAKSISLQASHTSSSPLSVTISHAKEIKLGLDTDQYDGLLLVIGIGSILIAAGLAVIYFVRRRRGEV